MADEKQKSNFIVRLFALFKSRRARNILYLVLIAYAAFSMFLIDNFNFLRDGDEIHPSPLSLLTNNLYSAVMDWFGIPRYDVTASSWTIFLVFAIVALVIVIGHIIAPKFVAKRVADNPTLFGTEKKTKVFYNVLYYGILILIAAAIIIIAAVAGLFTMFGANKNETNIFLSLLAMMGIFFLFLFALLIVIIVVYLIVRLITMAIAAIAKKK